MNLKEQYRKTTDKWDKCPWSDKKEIEFLQDYIKWLEAKLTLTDVCCSLPSKNERVKYCNDLANKHGVTEIFKRETLIKGFHLGFRYAKSFIK